MKRTQAEINLINDTHRLYLQIDELMGDLGENENFQNYPDKKAIMFNLSLAFQSTAKAWQLLKNQNATETKE